MIILFFSIVEIMDFIQKCPDIELLQQSFSRAGNVCVCVSGGFFFSLLEMNVYPIKIQSFFIFNKYIKYKISSKNHFNCVLGF